MALYDRLSELDAPVFRNIVSLRTSVQLFDDLVDDAGGQAAALAADLRMRSAAPGIVERGLLYSQAIDYPFRADPALASRFGDGTVRVWYGALEAQTACAETCYHALRQVLALEGESTPVLRYRAVYRVRAQGLFLELRGKQDEHPELIGDDYAATQAIGKHAAHQGLPGVLYPSARWPDGSCLAAFRADPLSAPTLSHYLTYRIDPLARTVEIERVPGVVEQRLQLGELQRRR